MNIKRNAHQLTLTVNDLKKATSEPWSTKTCLLATAARRIYPKHEGCGCGEVQVSKNTYVTAAIVKNRDEVVAVQRLFDRCWLDTSWDENRIQEVQVRLPVRCFIEHANT